MISDMHVHTRWSSDSVAPVEAQIERAIQLGMESLCITDHQDFDAPPFPPDYFKFLLNDVGDDEATAAYVADLTALKEKYRGRVELLIGIELGVQPHITEKLDQYAAKYPFDFIIGSTHTFQGMDAEDRRHYENVDMVTAVRQYFEEELKNVKGFRRFDVAGHMDFVLSYGPGAMESFSYGKYGDIIDEILKELIATGRGIECNTSKYMAKNMINPNQEIIKRYAELGGEIITFGSDAHTSDRLGEGFEEASQLVKSCGLCYYAVFRQHEPFFYKIE